MNFSAKLCVLCASALNDLSLIKKYRKYAIHASRTGVSSY